MTRKQTEVKISCRMCNKFQSVEDLDLIQGDYFCKYPYNSSLGTYDVKSCAEQQEDYLNWTLNRERPI